MGRKQWTGIHPGKVEKMLRELSGVAIRAAKADRKAKDEQVSREIRTEKREMPKV